MSWSLHIPTDHHSLIRPTKSHLSIPSITTIPRPMTLRSVNDDKEQTKQYSLLLHLIYYTDNSSKTPNKIRLYDSPLQRYPITNQYTF